MHTMPSLDQEQTRDQGRLRTLWRAAHEPVAGVSPTIRRIAFAVPLVVLPSGIWRLGVMFVDENQKRGGLIPDWAMDYYVVLLTLFSELLAFLAVGLVARWGEVFPRWMPRLGGRRVPITAPTVAALTSAAILTFLFTIHGVVGEITRTTVSGEPLPADFPSNAGGWETAYFYLCYAPLVLWGPMLAVLAVAYWRRRTPNER